jgi:metallophosphoesterase (TIGR00282 family)
MKILFIGDLYGEPGVSYFLENVNYLRQTYQPNIIIVNAENAANGRGLTKDIYKRLMSAGVSLITMGNHTFKNDELKTFIEGSRVIRPINDPTQLGDGYQVINYNGKKLLVINALGSVFMNIEIESPFVKLKRILEMVPHDYSFIDFHAETTSEKVAIGHYLDGLATVIVGTHTHIQTNDNRMLPNGTLYISDVGMTGPLNGVIGVTKEIIIDRFINGPSKPNVVAPGPRQLNGVIVTLEPKKSIEKIHIEETTQ